MSIQGSRKKLSGAFYALIGWGQNVAVPNCIKEPYHCVNHRFNFGLTLQYISGSPVVQNIHLLHFVHALHHLHAFRVIFS